MYDIICFKNLRNQKVSTFCDSSELRRCIACDGVNQDFAERGPGSWEVGNQLGISLTDWPACNRKEKINFADKNHRNKKM